jgi:YidC/Oxa1 family membrane protein insertase
MDYKRLFLYLALVFVGLQLWSAWEQYRAVPTQQTEIVSTSQQATPATSASNVPSLPNESIATQAQTVPTTQTTTPTQRIIEVTTDVLRVKIDTLGGNIIYAALLDYPQSVDEVDNPTLLLNDDPITRYVAQSGLTGKQGPDTPQGQVQYQVAQPSYQLEAGQPALKVVLTWKNAQGLQVNKQFTFTRGEYLIDLDYVVNNQTTENWRGNLYTQIAKTNYRPKRKGFFYDVTYLGAAISSPEKRFEKISFTDMDKSNLQRRVEGGWVAMLQHYFVSAWVPKQTQTNYLYSRISADGLYTIGALGPEIQVAPGEQKQVSAQFYTGPEIAETLEKIAPGLELTVDYGLLWFISVAIFWLMKHIYHFIGNWGWSIVLVTLFIKLLFYKLSATSYRSMAKMRKLQPRMQSLKEKYGSDKQKFSQALMEMYKKEKVNPLGGCLPILIQIPVFIALYWVLIESVELRQAPFILWIHDLSVKDPFYVLPILMGLTMFLQQRMSPTPPDPIQAKVMMMMPIVFTALFMTFPAGLVLYWFVNNSLSILQQWYIMRKVEQEAGKKRH